jgi:subtilisin family serine protease
MSLLKLFDLFNVNEYYSKKRINDFDLLFSEKLYNKEKIEDSNLFSLEKLFIKEKVEDSNLFSLEKFDYKIIPKPQEQVEISVASIVYENATNVNGEITPWGVRAVWQGEDISLRGNFASDTYAFVIDSGVSNITGDINLASDLNWHRSWIYGETPFEDYNGHGTHIAGTIGALVNGKGIVGVAPGAQIVSLKVNNKDGFGDDLTTTEAVNYAAYIINSNNLDKSKVVINLSLSGTYSSRLDAAIKNAADQGIKFSVSAGNNGKDADGYSPASAGDHPNVYTVSAVNNQYVMPFWSNWDRIDSNDFVDDVDLTAPGVGVLSYYKNGQLAYLSGTSMATAHVSGLLITGGVQAGNYVTPYYSGTSDQFAITATQTFVPSDALSKPQEPYIPPSPTYTISSDTSINEGQVLQVEVSTTNLKVGSYVHWEISGTGIDMSDFNAIHNLWGASQVNSDGKATIKFDVKNDNLTEGNEVIKFELFDSGHHSIRKKVGETTITIQDTSKTPIVTTPQSLWGTVGNDIITGGDGPDSITGVSPSGTTPSEMGRGQIDILTGGLGADIFILADGRGVFYNDGIRGNLGTSDYALIKDFKRGEDKIQLNKRFSYTFETINGDGYLYLNTNRTTTIEKWGPNQEELIAVIEGFATRLQTSDFILV